MKKNDEYLVFVDIVGKPSNNVYLYEFDFSDDMETVWGDYFNITPSILVPDLKVDKNCLTSTMRISMDCRMFLAKSNSCFSMQDAIDGIIPLCFPSLSSDYKEINFKPVFFMFGDTKNDVITKVDACGWNINSDLSFEKPESELDKVINGSEDE